jgi:hypothetical protein
MQEINRDDQAESIDTPMKINVPHYGIDLRRILFALKDEILTHELCFSPKIEKKFDNVIVPTLRRRFKMRPVRDFIVIHYIRDVKVPVIMDGDKLSDHTIDVISNYLERMQVNYPKP